MVDRYKKSPKEDLGNIINDVKEILGLNLIGKGRILEEMKGTKGLILVKNKKTGVYEHETPDAKRECFYRTLNGMLLDKKFSESRSVIRAYRGVDEKFVKDVSTEIFKLHEKKLDYHYDYLVGLTDKDDKIITRLDILIAKKFELAIG